MISLLEEVLNVVGYIFEKEIGTHMLSKYRTIYVGYILATIYKLACIR